MLRLVPRIQIGQTADLIADGIPPVLAKLLAARGIETPAMARAFLSPDLSHLYDPYLMEGMRQAVEAIEGAMQAGERIVLYGDYDVDGVCGVAILYEYLMSRKANVDYYIPARHGEGYGLNMDAVEKLAHEASLLITVDCGITNAAEVQRACELGLRVIVTDHHEPPGKLPKCEAVLNPLLGDYPFKRLCGAGVAFKLVTALGGLSAALPVLDIAALATVADLVPLLDENRVLVACGLPVIQRTERPGLRALIDISGLEGKRITAGHLGFQLGPRINAGGRLGHAGRSVTLLTTCDQEEADAIAQDLHAENTKRQQIEKMIFDEADAWVRANAAFLTDRVLVVPGKGWNPGVVGLVASRLVEKYRWPVLLLSVMDGVCVGSARSIPGVNIHAAMETCADLFTRFGGHAQAAGVTMPEANIQAFRARLNEAIRIQADPESFVPTDLYDLDLPLSEVTVPFIELLEKLAPTGIGNPSPTFCVRDAQVLSKRCVGRDQAHLQVQLSQGGNTVGGIAFRQGTLAETLPDRVDALYAPTINEWNGRRMPQCEVQRLLPHAPLTAFRTLCEKSGESFAGAALKRIRAGQRPSLSNHPLPGLQAYLGLYALRAAVKALLTEGCQGTLLIAYTLEGVRDWADWLMQEGLDTRLQYVVGTPQDAQGFHALCAAPDLVTLKPHYAHLVFLEGMTPREELLLARAACPDAALYIARDAAADAWQRTAIASWAPDEAALRRLYKLVKGGHFPSITALANASSLTETAAWAGLAVFEELELITLTHTPLSISMLPPRKCSLYGSRLFAGLAAWAGKGEGA